MQSDSMNVLDYIYEPRESFAEKTTAQLAHEIDVMNFQAGVIASVSLMAYKRVGERLLEIKSRVGHGNFEDWCTANIKCSKRKAERMMKLSKVMDDPQSPINDSDYMRLLGISKIWALTDTDNNTVRQLIDNYDIQYMNVREIRKIAKEIRGGSYECNRCDL